MLTCCPSLRGVRLRQVRYRNRAGTGRPRQAIRCGSFEPGARKAWHTHPLGQKLIVIAGSGWVQEAGKPAQSIKPGDTVWIAPYVKHWHVATAETSMSHIAIAEAQDGKVVEWMEKVGEQEYPQL